MDILKWKIFASNNLPTWAFLRLAKIYRLVTRAFANSPPFKASSGALEIRIPQRRLVAKDRLVLARPENYKLQQWDEAFSAYAVPCAGSSIDLAWTHKPVGGNFGDWLAPYIVNGVVDRAIRHIDLADPRNDVHVLSLGSIISRANKNSIVIGSGINSIKDEINRSAIYRMVRGCITLEKIPAHAKSSEIYCCDPGFFMREIYSPHRLAETSSKLLIPHINHESLFSRIDSTGYKILHARACRPQDIERLIDKIASAREVITSAMHIFVMCCTYKIPCALIKPIMADVVVPGDGIKYRDCMSPIMVTDFTPTMVDLRSGTKVSEIVDTKLYEIDFDYIKKSYLRFHEILAEMR